MARLAAQLLGFSCLGFVACGSGGGSPAAGSGGDVGTNTPTSGTGGLGAGGLGKAGNLGGGGATSNGRTYHLDATKGADTNDGSQAKPWKTFSYALGKVASGDTVLMYTGSYGAMEAGRTDKKLPIPVVFTDWVTFKAAPGEKPQATSLAIGTWNGEDGKAILFTQKGNSDLYMRFEGLLIDDGVRIEGSRHVEVRGCEIHNVGDLHANMQKAGIAVFNGQHVTLEGNDISHTAIGIQGMSYDLVIRKNHIHHNAHDGFSVIGGENILIEGNTVHDIDDGANDTDGASWNMHVDGMQIYMVGQTNSKYAETLKGLVFRGNTLYHIEAMGVMIGANATGQDYENFTFENNVFGPVGGIGFHLGADIKGGMVFRHNTFAYAPNDTWTSIAGRAMTGQEYTCALWDNTDPGYKFYNNVFAMNKAVPNYAFVANNLYMGPATTLGRGEIVRPELPYKSIPGTIDDYLAQGGKLGELTPGSFAVNAGTVQEPISQDILGKARDAQPDPGAYEQ